MLSWREHQSHMRVVWRLYCVGIAGDYCVNFTAADSAKAGFKTYVIEEGQRCVDAGSWADVVHGFRAGGVEVVSQDSERIKRLLN